MQLSDDVQYIKGVGPGLAKKLNKLGLHTLNDLMFFFPYRYEDRSKTIPFTQVPAQLGQNVMVRGRVVSVKLTIPRPHFYIVKVFIEDANHELLPCVWFNQKFISTAVKEGMSVFISGKVVYNDFEHEPEIHVEDYEILKGAGVELGIVPFYSLTEGVYQKRMRQIVHEGLKYVQAIKDALPFDMVVEEKLMVLTAAILEMHNPTDRQRWKKARERLVFDEFLYPQLGMAIRYVRTREQLVGISFKPEGNLLDKYYTTLPYTLTGAQKRVAQEILQDMSRPKPMNRLVQGDVGSGKTDIAIIATLCAVQSGYQVAIMTPTEILATQHFAKISQRLTALGVRVISLLGKHTAKEKEQYYKALQEHQADVVIGTSAIIQEKVIFAKLGLAIIDEQHRFGVVQRNLLKAKGNENIDLLVMTATPIPRTLALTVYGDLDKSVIDELPPGRTPIKTFHVFPQDRNKVYELVRRELEAGHQAYIIYPLVEESEKIDLKAAVESYELIRTTVYPDKKVGLLHGRLKNIEKDAVMNQFRNKELDILVSTTVIEVGVDVPNATVMVIENANRFGLAQLHQLRGRVGRGAARSNCYLITELKSPESKRRIGAMVETTDGFKLAEVDLELRGPGDFVGVRQAGFPELALADFIKDELVMKHARELAFRLVHADPQLINEKHALIRKELIRRTRGLTEYILLN